MVQFGREIVWKPPVFSDGTVVTFVRSWGVDRKTGTSSNDNELFGKSGITVSGQKHTSYVFLHVSTEHHTKTRSNHTKTCGKCVFVRRLLFQIFWPIRFLELARINSTRVRVFCLQTVSSNDGRRDFCKFLCPNSARVLRLFPTVFYCGWGEM